VYMHLLYNHMNHFLQLRNLPHSSRLSLRNVCVCEVDERIAIAPDDHSEVVGTTSHLCVAVRVRGVTRVLSFASALV